MLTDKLQIECVKNAWEPGIRDPKRPRAHFENIINYFFRSFSFRKANILDLGPGHYDFGEIVRRKGGEATAIELDPAVIRLGKLKNMEVVEGDLTDPRVFANMSQSFDGLFCRGSFNARNFPNQMQHREYLESLISVVKPNGVFWISPCNDPMKESNSGQDVLFKECVDFQIQFFRSNGFEIIECSPAFVRAFGIWSTKPELIFTKNLKFDQSIIEKKLKINSTLFDFPKRLFTKLIGH